MDPTIEHMLDTGGRSLSAADRKFVSLLFGELEQFQYQAPKDRALMFHPLRGYERYLIHKVTEIFPKLTSFSIGDEQTRRTVVCFKSKRKEQQMQFGQQSPEKRPASRGSSKEPKSARPQLNNKKSKTLEPSPTRGRRRTSEPVSRSKSGKYNTWGDDALRKRERGLNLEGTVVNGQLDHSRSDVENTRRSSRNPIEAKKKFRSRRSRSQPHLHDRSKGKQHQRPYNDDSTDHHPSDNDTMERKNRRRPSSDMNTSPVKQHDTQRSKPVRVYEKPKQNPDDSHLSSGTDVSSKDFSFRNSDVDNELPPSYDTTSTTTRTTAKSKAKRNMKRIQRTNSTRSCPALNEKNRQPEYVNSEAAVEHERDTARNFEDSPVFPRPTKHNLKDIDGRRNSDAHSDKRNDRFTTEGIPVEEIEVPFNNRRTTSSDENQQASPRPSETSPLDSHSTETSVIVHHEPTLANGLPQGKQPTAPSNEELERVTDVPSYSDEKRPSSTPVVMSNAEVKKYDKKIQTDLTGPVIQAMMSIYDDHLSGQLTPQNRPPVPPDVKPQPPVSLHMTSGTSSPNTASPSSPYEKLGEYMYKAMLNFQSMLIGGQAPPPSHDFRASNGPSPFAPPTALFTPPTVQPLYVPWMGPQYYPDSNRQHQPSLPYSPQQNCEPCYHLPHHHVHQPPEQLNKMPQISQANLKDLRKENHIGALPRNDNWESSRGYRYPENNMERSTSSVPSRSSKAIDGFDSDVSSEITNPEITVTEGGNGVMVYVRNSNRSTSSTGASVGDTSSLLGVNGDSGLRASPLGDEENTQKRSSSSVNNNNNNIGQSKKQKEKSSSRKSSNASKKSNGSRSKDKFPLVFGEKHKKRNAEVKDPRITNEEVILSLSSAPLARLEDDDEIDGSVTGSYASSHSCLSTQHDKMSHTSEPPVAEDLSPSGRFDDALEISRQDESAEE